MPGDPQIFQPAAEQGFMRNTFTGVRATFPNVDIHMIIREKILPFREELCRRPEFQSQVVWREALTLFCHQSLQAISDGIKMHTYRAVMTADQRLADRSRVQSDFIAAANSPNSLLEDLLANGIPSHRDQQMNPASPHINTITVDFSGEDPKYPQPSPGRYPDAKMRILVVGLDHLLVEMTNCPSADAPSMINPEDAAFWQSCLVDGYALVTRAGTIQTPYIPTGLGREQYDGIWNANRGFDRPIEDGSAQWSDVPTTLKTASANRR